LLLVIELLISTKIIHPKRPVTVAKRGAFQITTLLIFMIISPAIFAQNDKSIIKKGNDAYSKKDFDKAIESYKKVTGKDPSNATAQYNLGNALYRNKMTDDAIAAYDNAVNNLNAPEDKSRSYYNKGVVLQNNKKLPECIEAYKNALKLNPGDDDARQNLQKALQQQKQQQQQQKDKKNQDQKKNKEDDKQKEKQKPKDEDKNDQPKPQPSKLTKQDAEEKLKALLEQEKNLQDKLKKINTATLNKPEKDW
jgi:tetratricopeptide (TPR) repeat protein